MSTTTKVKVGSMGRIVPRNKQYVVDQQNGRIVSMKHNPKPRKVRQVKEEDNNG
jgi:hypothetical protein